MRADMCVPCGDGLINIRAGALILKDGKMLMVSNEKRPGYLYTVGGRIRFGETPEEAVVREAYEETGVHLEIERLGFIHETYFHEDALPNLGKLIYEIAYYFYMKVPGDFAPVSDSFSEGDHTERLLWIAPDDPVSYFPGFLRTEVLRPSDGVRRFVTDGRNT